jgi:signal transduction histidine kinase
MPLSAGGEFLGIVVCLRADPADDWRPVEIDAFEWIAADVGRGLKYAQLFEEEGRLVERFRELDQAKNDFIATVSHELRTPLTSIAGYAEMLQDGEAGPLSPPQQDMLHTIDRNTSRLRSLIEDVLTLSKVETGAFRTVMQPVALAGVISAAVEAITPETSKRQLSVTTRIGDPPLTVEGDEAQLDRVLMNVLSNAVKFTPPRGKVSVSAYRDGDFAVVEVTDSGIGIPGKDQKEIFSPFFRAANAVRTAIPGSGLGLRIVRTIVANHGGELDLRSREGQGTIVTIRLPLPPASTGTSDGKPVTISTLPAAEAGQP